MEVNWRMGVEWIHYVATLVISEVGQRPVNIDPSQSTIHVILLFFFTNFQIKKNRRCVSVLSESLPRAFCLAQNKKGVVCGLDVPHYITPFQMERRLKKQLLKKIK